MAKKKTVKKVTKIVPAAKAVPFTEPSAEDKEVAALKFKIAEDDAEITKLKKELAYWQRQYERKCN